MASGLPPPSSSSSLSSSSSSAALTVPSSSSAPTLLSSSSSLFAAKEKTNYTKLSRLLIGVGRCVLQDVFDAIYPPSGLDAALCSEIVYSTLTNLRSRRMLNTQQWKILFPGPGSSASSANFDVIILFLLLRNICSLAPPATGWDRQPLPSDQSMQADLVRIKLCRNELYAHTLDLTLSDTAFETNWNDIKGALIRLGGSKYEAEIEQLKVDSIDAESENTFNVLLQTWEEGEEKILDAMRRLDVDVKGTGTSSEEILVKGLVKIATLGGVVLPWAAGSAYLLHRYSEDPEMMLQLVEKAIIPCGVVALAGSTVVPGSFVIKIRVSSLEALDQLRESFQTGEMKKRLETALLKALAPDVVENITISISISEDDYGKARDSLMTSMNREITISDENEEPDTVPPEIRARGPPAQRAYRHALKNGKVKNRRLPVVVVGQSHSGKTSLLRSLNGEKFNSSEDSTVGAKLQRSLSKVDGDWEKNENNESLMYNHCTAMEVVKHLLKEPAQPNPDKEHDINSVENNENAQNNATTRLVEQKNLQPQEDPVMEANNTTQNVDNVENQGELLPDEVAMYTEFILENTDAEKQMEKYLFFHTMDFAGQPIYSVTHPVFLPPKGIYLLVHSLENDLHAQATPIVKTGAVKRKIDHDPMTNIDHLKFWLSLIDANSTQEGASPVLVVSTHKDKPFEADVQHTARKILSTLTEEDFAPGRHVVHRICTVDNTISGSSSPKDADIKELKSQLCKTAKSLPQMNEDIPVRWLLFEKKLRNEKKKHITFKEAEKIALQCEVDVSSDELDTLLNYLHDLKVIIHFPETGMIIIDTQWLLDMFAKVITVQPVECHEGHVNEWRKLEHQGIVDVKFLEHLWKDFLDDNTSVVSLIRIMEKFSLVCKQRDESFLVPAMLSNSTVDAAHELMKSDDCASPLVVRFKSSHLPVGLFPRLLVAVEEMRLNLKCKSSTPPHLSRNFARFYIHSDDDYEFSLIFMADTSTIAVALINDVNQSRRDDVYVQQCKSILEFLRKTLKEMVTSFPWMKSLTEFDFCIRCPICLTSCKKHNQKECYRDSCVHLVSEKELLMTAKARCEKNPTKRNVIPNTSHSHWFPRSKCQSRGGKRDVKTTCTPVTLCSSSRKVEDNQCTDIVPLLNLMPPSISMDEATKKAKEIAVYLNLDKNSVEDSPDEAKRMCREFCKTKIETGQINCVEALRNELPNGMTGPLQFKHDLLVKDMDLKIKENLSKALTVREMEWKIFAKDKVNLSTDEIDFLHVRKTNSVFEILNKHCGDWSVDELYTAIVDCGANAIADRYL